MFSERQIEILAILKTRPNLAVKYFQESLGLTRARINQLIVPLIKKGIIKKQGKARATVYSLKDKQNKDLLIRENWVLKNRVRDLEKALEDRKLIERAKEILIAQFDISPTESYRKLQLQSMESGRSMREIAESIIYAYGG